jgi:hypothetical protein
MNNGFLKPMEGFVVKLQNVEGAKAVYHGASSRSSQISVVLLRRLQRTFTATAPPCLQRREEGGGRQWPLLLNKSE